MRYDSHIRSDRSDGSVDRRFASDLAAAVAPALRLATVVLGTDEGADDVVQVAVERAWRAQRSYDPSRPLLPWFLRIVANTARNDRRRRGRAAALRLRVAGQPAPADPTPEDHAVSAADRRAVLDALNELDADDRTILALRYVEQLSEADVATALDCPLGTVKSRLSRAKARLRRRLDVAEVTP